MYNDNALEYSNAVLEEQKQFFLDTHPCFTQILDIDSISNMKCDYLFGIDMIATLPEGKTRTVQFKNRLEGGTDFMLYARKLTGLAATKGRIGFWFQKTKYTFFPTADFYVERIDGQDYTISLEDIETIESVFSVNNNAEKFITSIRQKMISKDDGTKFPSEDFYVYISLGKLKTMLQAIFNGSNPNLFM